MTGFGRIKLHSEGKMRQGQNPKRPRGRGNNRRNAPGRHHTFDSNGPSVRIRGSAHQVHEKYLALARDANVSDDRIAAENYLQHAEHYYRIINVDSDDGGRGRTAQTNAGERGGDNRKSGNGADAAAAESGNRETPETALNGSPEASEEPAEAEVTITTPAVEPAPADDESETGKSDAD